MHHLTNQSATSRVIDKDLLDSIRICQEAAREGKLGVERTMALYHVLSSLADCYLYDQIEGKYIDQNFQGRYQIQR